MLFLSLCRLGLLVMEILNLADGPDVAADPIERLVYLSGVMEQVRRELDDEYQQAYFWARHTGRFPDALHLALHSRKRTLAFTRAENEARGRMIRWSDGY